MVTEKEFNSVFDYSSAFQYGSPDIKMKIPSEKYKSAFSYRAIPIAEDGFENSLKEAWPSVILRNAITFVLYIFAIVFFPFSIFLCLKKVHALERIVLLRLGKLQPIQGPGLAVILPCIDKWTKVDLKPKLFTVSTSQSLTADGGIIEAKSDIEYRVSDVLNYVMKLNQQEDTLRDLSLFCLRNIISEKEQDDLELKREIISCNIKNELNRSAINWGLEIICVTIHSVKILKAAEPVNALDTIMTALKAATGQSSEKSTPLFPFLSPVPENATAVQIETANPIVKPDENIGNFNNTLDIVSKLTNDAVKEGKLKNLAAKFKLDILGSTSRTIFLVFGPGEEVSVFEDENHLIDWDVRIELTEEVLYKFLSRDISPLNAYMDGQVTVEGDWKLLKYLTKIFH